MEAGDLNRRVLIGLDAAGTFYFWDGGQRPPTSDALPIFSVDTEEEAIALRTRFCKRAYSALIWLWPNFAAEAKVDPIATLYAAGDAMRAEWIKRRTK